MCENCDEYDIEIKISTHGQLKRLLKKIKVAVENKKLTYNSFESDRALINQPSFEQLDLDGNFPDVIRYYFDCSDCGNVFGLIVETYHGHGGTWSMLGNINP